MMGNYELYWLLFALLTSIVSALYYLSTQNIKINANAFMVYRGWFLVIILLPILGFYLFFTSSYPPLEFYVMSLLQGGIVAYTDYLSFRVNKNYGAETVSSIVPCSAIMVFFMWCIINPEIIGHYLENPLQTICIITSLLGTTIALLNYKRVRLAKKALLFLIPVLFLSSTISILNKQIMSYSADNKWLCACLRVWIVSLIIGTIHLRIYIKKGYKIRELFDFNNIKKSFIFVLLLLLMVFKSLAMFYADNPAYVSCIVYTSLIWVIFFGRYIPVLKFHRTKVLIQKKWEFLLIASVILLVLTTR